jgi:uncharacterized protein DUF4190
MSDTIEPPESERPVDPAPAAEPAAAMKPPEASPPAPTEPPEAGPPAPTEPPEAGPPAATEPPTASPPPATPPAAPPPMPGQPAMPPNTSNGFAVAALVLGILTIVFFFTFWFDWLMGALAIVFGALGIARANKGARQKGMAIAGLVCGAVGIVFSILFIVLIVNVANNSDVKDVINSVIQSLQTPSP